MNSNSLFTLFLVLLLSSCTHLKTPSQKSSQNPLPSLSTLFSKICLTHEGKARLKMADENHKMAHEAILDEKAGKWSLTFFIPLRGEESLTLNWKEGRGKVEGSFVKELEKNRAEDNYLLELFFYKLSLYIRFLNNRSAFEKCAVDPLLSNEERKEGRCYLDDGTPLAWSQKAQKIIFFMPLYSTKEIIVETQFDNDGINEIISFTLRDYVNKSFLEKLKLDLMLNSCKQNA